MSRWACLLTLLVSLCAQTHARDVVAIGDISDQQVQQAVAAFHGPSWNTHSELLLATGPQIAAIAITNHSSSQLHEVFPWLAASPELLTGRDTIVCSSSGGPNTFGRFLEDNKARIANAAGSLAASLPGGIYIYLDKVRCKQNVACSVIVGVTSLAAGTYTYTEVQMDVGTGIDKIHNACANQKGTDSDPPDGSTIKTTVSTSSDQNANCNSAPTDNCRTVPPKQ